MPLSFVVVEWVLYCIDGGERTYACCSEVFYLWDFMALEEGTRLDVSGLLRSEGGDLNGVAGRFLLFFCLRSGWAYRGDRVRVRGEG